jgi:phosphate transport system protein
MPGRLCSRVTPSRRLGSAGTTTHLHTNLFTVLMDREWTHGVAATVDVTLLGRFYERFADHAVEIGRRVVFEVTGGTGQRRLE